MSDWCLTAEGSFFHHLTSQVKEPSGGCDNWPYRCWLSPIGWLFVNHVIYFVNTLTNICVLVIFSPGKYAVFLICIFLATM